MHQFIPKEFVCAFVLIMANALAVKSETVPLPHARPPVLEDQLSAPKIESERSPCQLQLSEIAEFKSMPPITGPGECTATDVVSVNAVVLPDNHRVVFSPVVTLQCSMAEVVAHWIRDDVAPTLDALGMSLRGVETLESFGCRTLQWDQRCQAQRARPCQRIGRALAENGQRNRHRADKCNGQQTVTRTVTADGVRSLFDGTRQRSRCVS